jgi:hypothetical protein
MTMKRSPKDEDAFCRSNSWAVAIYQEQRRIEFEQASNREWAESRFYGQPLKPGMRVCLLNYLGGKLTQVQKRQKLSGKRGDARLRA